MSNKISKEDCRRMILEDMFRAMSAINEQCVWFNDLMKYYPMSKDEKLEFLLDKNNGVNEMVKKYGWNKEMAKCFVKMLVKKATDDCRPVADGE